MSEEWDSHTINQSPVYHCQGCDVEEFRHCLIDVTGNGNLLCLSCSEAMMESINSKLDRIGEMYLKRGDTRKQTLNTGR